MHIIKWYSEPQKRSSSWIRTIDYSRTGILKTQKKQPSLNDDFINENWDEVFEDATKEAEKEMLEPSKVKQLTWNDVFFSKYTLLIVVIVAVAYFMRG